VPTRELAIQIKDEYMIFARGLNMGVVATVGGTDIWRQIQGLRRKPQFVIGTPGRLRDLIERRELDLSHFHNVVLDEVDRMVDMGFIQDIKYLLGLLPKDRHSLFFTATIDARTQEILNGFVAEDPVKVSVKQQSTNENIEQDVVRVPHGTAKLDVLMELLKRPGFDKVLIFGRTKRGVENLSHLLYTNGFQTVAIHGNKSQHQRNRALQAFKDNKVNIMIATDVAARGLDIDSVTHVINYEAPTSYDDYVHRIGRTGRAGKRGFALTFID
jgi:superfamily II DNA/RNA helicase